MWKMLGLTVQWIIGGAILGLVVSTAFAIVWGVQMVFAYERSPGNDPLVPLVLMWAFFLAPGGMTLGAIVGGLTRIALSAWGQFRDHRIWKSESTLWLAACLMLAVPGCGSEIGPESDDYPHAERAAAEIALASAGVADVVNPAPDGDELGKCEQCNGTGKVGDGRTMVTCQACGGDGKVDPDDISEAIEPVGEIVMQITEVTRHGWPEEWYREYAQVFRDRGWEVGFEKHPASEKQAAYIDVTIGGKTHQFYGPIEPKHLRHLEITQ